MLAETTMSFVILVGGVTESVRKIAAAGCVRASSRRAETKRGAEDLSQK